MNNNNLKTINDKINANTKKLIKLIKKFNPYDILSNLFTHTCNKLFLNNDMEKISDKDKVEAQFNIELVYGLIICIDKNDFENNNLKEISINKIISICEKIFKLKHQAMTFISLNSNLNEHNREYIFDDLLRQDITGKRYMFFENEHHKESLKPIFKYIKEKYQVDEKKILDGIDNLKLNIIYGFRESIDEIEKIISNNNIDEIYDINEETKQKLQKSFNNIISIEYFNVLRITDWSISFINIFSAEIGEMEFDFNYIDFLSILKIQGIINKKPIIKIEDDYYCIRLTRFLDNFDRILLKRIYKDNDNENKTKSKIEKEFSSNIEDYTKRIFFKILGENANYYQNTFYKKNGKTIENDLIIEQDDYLFIIEIKSGSFTPDVAYENISSHMKTIDNLIIKAENQILEIENELKEKGSLTLYKSNQKKPEKKALLEANKYKEIFKFIINFEGFNEITARAEKIGIINLNKDIIACSIDDLEVYGDFFKNEPINFINYITNRVLATRNKLINLNDELDHLGLYLEWGCYSIQVNEMAKEYKNIGMILFDDFRAPINDYYDGKYYGNEVEKPVLKYPKHIKKIIDFLNSHYVNNNLIIGNTLIKCNSDEQANFEAYMEDMIEFTQKTNRYKYLAFIVGDYLFIISCCINTINNEQILIRDCYANLKISPVKEAYAMFIIYDNSENILRIKTKHLTKNDYQYKNDFEIIKTAELLKNKRKNTVQTKSKIGRNEPCPCGSGIKYKKCCGK